MMKTRMQLVSMPFVETLKELSHAVSPELVKQRIGWRDRAGRDHEVDYVEWHAVADLLDRICPDWSHQVTQHKADRRFRRRHGLDNYSKGDAPGGRDRLGLRREGDQEGRARCAQTGGG